MKVFKEPVLKILLFCRRDNIILKSRVPVEPITDGGNFDW